MNEYKLELVARHRPEVLERILRVARHRGFTVTTMEMTVRSDRTLELLVNQLVKLLDVLMVN